MNPKLPPIPNRRPYGTQNHVAFGAKVQRKSPKAIAALLRKDTTLTPDHFISTLVIGEKL